MAFSAEDYLMHHGIKGQKWGVRRFQNPDGSLTPAGVKRYGTVENYERAREARREKIASAGRTAASIAKKSASTIGSAAKKSASTIGSAAKKTAITAAEISGARHGAYEKARHGENKKSKNASDDKREKAKKIAKGVAIGAGIGLAAYGAYKISKLGTPDKGFASDIDDLIKNNNRAIDDLDFRMRTASVQERKSLEEMRSSILDANKRLYEHRNEQLVNFAAKGTKSAQDIGRKSFDKYSPELQAKAREKMSHVTRFAATHDASLTPTDMLRSEKNIAKYSTNIDLARSKKNNGIPAKAITRTASFNETQAAKVERLKGLTKSGKNRAETQKKLNDAILGSSKSSSTSSHRDDPFESARAFSKQVDDIASQVFSKNQASLSEYRKSKSSNRGRSAVSSMKLSNMTVDDLKKLDLW